MDAGVPQNALQEISGNQFFSRGLVFGGLAAPLCEENHVSGHGRNMDVIAGGVTFEVEAMFSASIGRSLRPYPQQLPKFLDGEVGVVPWIFNLNSFGHAEQHTTISPSKSDDLWPEKMRTIL